MRRLTDLEGDILDEQDRVLFHEAIVSSTAGAARGAYILIWLCCAESLKRRFREVGRRDGAARKVSGEIERKEGAHSAIDSFLLKEARTYGFIDEPGHARLEHVYRMRCLYGHPYERQPSEEDLVSAATTVADLVLHQPVLLRHGYLQEQIRLLTSDSPFLDDQDNAVVAYAKEVALRTDPIVIEWFIDKLWVSGEALVADKMQIKFVRRVIWFSSAFVQASGLDLRACDVRLLLVRAPTIAACALSVPELFPLISSHAQDIVVGNLVQHVKTDISIAARLEPLDQKGLLNNRQRERFIESLQTVGYRALAGAGIALRYYATLLLAGMKSHNWYAQNPALDALASAGPTAVAELDGGIQRQLGNNVLQCAAGAAASAGPIMEAIEDGTVTWPPAFVEGLVEECFVNDEGRVRFKTDHLKKALFGLSGLTPTERKGIVDRVAARVEVGSPKPVSDPEGGRTDALIAMEFAMKGRPEDLGVLDGLRKAVEGFACGAKRQA